jgi:hypothetical protein
MVLEITTPTSREDWRRIPQILEFEKQFAAVLGNTGMAVPAKQQQLEQLWPNFKEALWQSAELIESQRQLIEVAVKTDLKGRLAAQSTGQLFEARGPGGLPQGDPTTFDLLDVDDAPTG